MLSVGGSIMWTVLCLVQHIEEKISSKFFIYRKKLYILYKNYILPILDLFLLYILTLDFFFFIMTAPHSRYQFLHQYLYCISVDYAMATNIHISVP